MRWCSLHQSCIYIRFIWKTMFSPMTHSDTSHCMLISSLQWAWDCFIQQECFIPHVLTTLLCLYCTRAHMHTRDYHSTNALFIKGCMDFRHVCLKTVFELYYLILGGVEERLSQSSQQVYNDTPIFTDILQNIIKYFRKLSKESCAESPCVDAETSKNGHLI